MGPRSPVDVPVGARHRHADNGTEELVEVKRGGRPGENDIVRLEDDFGRCPQPEPSSVEYITFVAGCEARRVTVSLVCSSLDGDEHYG